MFITYDSEADALYVQLRQPHEHAVIETDELDIYRYVDYDEQGTLIGVELLGVSRGIDLTDVPEGEQVAAAIRALPTVAAQLRQTPPAA